MGSSNFTGALGDFLAAIQGSNLGGGSHAAALLDEQVVAWCKEMIGFPASSSGTLVSGGSMANIIGLTVARNVKAGDGFVIPNGARHDAHNTGTTTLKLAAIYVVEKGKPLATPAP